MEKTRVEKESKKPCIHHWLLGAAAKKGYFQGKCLKCGERRKFIDYLKRGRTRKEYQADMKQARREVRIALG